MWEPEAKVDDCCHLVVNQWKCPLAQGNQTDISGRAFEVVFDQSLVMLVLTLLIQPILYNNKPRISYGQ